MTEPEFVPFPKIGRLFRDIVITEKIDGTNAAIGFDDSGNMWTQSRKRLITVADDNFGFAAWAEANHGMLFYLLGEGLHFGEWWGSGIQRGYGLPKGEKRFSLFNTKRWYFNGSQLPGLYSVPVLYEGPFSENEIDAELSGLRHFGSKAAPGFMNPEGIIIYHSAANTLFKTTLENDEQPKGFVA